MNQQKYFHDFYHCTSSLHLHLSLELHFRYELKSNVTCKYFLRSITFGGSVKLNGASVRSAYKIELATTVLKQQQPKLLFFVSISTPKEKLFKNLSLEEICLFHFVSCLEEYTHTDT